LVDGEPHSYFLPYFFFPQGFMTGVLQTHARKYAIAIDSLNFGFKVSGHESGDNVAAEDVPEDGVLVSGLFLVGARWDRQARLLEESEPGRMTEAMPMIHFEPIKDYKPVPAEYQCPLYKTSVRAGVLDTTGTSTNFILPVALPTTKDTDFWVLQGVALLTMPE